MTTETSKSQNSDDTLATNYQNTSELFRSNLFRFECQELLSESYLHLLPGNGSLIQQTTKSQLAASSNPKTIKWSSTVQDYITNVKQIVFTTFSQKNVKPGDKDGNQARVLPIPKNDNNNSSNNCLFQIKSDRYQRLKSDWKIPMPTIDSKNESNCTINIHAVGSYANHCMTKKEANGYVLPTIDLVIIVGPRPNEKKEEDGSHKNQNNNFWMSKDYLNHRYLDKRNILMHYIGTVLRHKKNRNKVGNVTFSQISSSPSKLCVILTPSSALDNKSTQSPSKKRNKDKYRFRVRLLIGIPPMLFSPSRFFPSRNNLLSSTGNTTNKNNEVEEDDQNTDTINIDGTPTYNSNILAYDGMYGTLTSLFQTEFASSSSIVESIVLLKVWLAQRGMRNGHDTLNSTGLSLLMLYLLRTKRISPRMSCWEMIVIWLKFVSEIDWLGDKKEYGDELYDSLSSMVGVESTTAADMGNNETMRTSKTTNHSMFYTKRFSQKKYKRKQHVLVMPGINPNTNTVLSETQTIANANQTQLYKEMLSSESHHQRDYLPSTLIEAFQEYTDGPVFLDSTLRCNFLAHCSPSSMNELMRDAKRTLNVIHNCEEKRSGVLRNIFCSPCRFWRKFDVFVKIPMNQIDATKVQNLRGLHHCNGVDRWKRNVRDLGKMECVVRGMIDLLTMALSDRITGIRPLSSGNGEGTEIYSKKQSPQQQLNDYALETDQIPIRSVNQQQEKERHEHNFYLEKEPTMTSCLPDHIVLGIRLNPENASRIFDRGPPAEDSHSSAQFVSLWGKHFAQLRRFKDGAIVHAVVWKDVLLSGNEKEFSNSDSSGGIVEKIVQHVLQLHFLKEKANVKFELRNMLSLVEGLSKHNSSSSDECFHDSFALHKDVMKAFDSLSTLLKQDKSLLGLPLGIDAVEPISPCLRYSSIFPPVPHPLLDGKKLSCVESKVSTMTFGEPILIQIRFEGSNKWPTDIDAMGAAKCAMLIKLASLIEEGKCAGFSRPAVVYPNHLDVGYKGYSWRIIVRADQELRMLDSLRQPSLEAIKLYETLTIRHIVSSLHHSSIHAIHTRHPSASSAVRLAQRWISAHMLSGCISIEALELIVTQAYINPYPLDPPSTAVAGFLRFLYILGKFDWVREPFIVDPQGHLTSNDISQIRSQFESIRGDDYKNGPAMFVISPFDRIQSYGATPNVGAKDDNKQSNDKWIPTSTERSPEAVFLSRMSTLALLSYRSLMRTLMENSSEKDWTIVFQESPSSIKSYSALLRVSPEVVIDSSCCSTGGHFSIVEKKDGGFESPFSRSLKKKSLGPKSLRMKLYKNITNNIKNSMMHGWQPVEELVANLRSKFGTMAVFFYNELSPNVIAMLWRPNTFQAQAFSVANTEYKRPAGKQVIHDSLMVTNPDDVLREVEHIAKDIVVDMKILDARSFSDAVGKSSKRKRKAYDLNEEENNDDDKAKESDEDDHCSNTENDGEESEDSSN